MLKLMGNVSKMLFKDVDGLHCPEKYLSFCLETLWGIKDESEPFSSLLWLWSAMETVTNIYVRQTFVHWGTPCSCVGASTTKGDDALSHWCKPNLHPCAQDLKQAQQQQELSLEKSQLCPQAPLSSAHLPVKTSEPRLISNGIHPTPISLHTRTCFCIHPHKPLWDTRRSRPCQPAKVLLLSKHRCSLQCINNPLSNIIALAQ